MSIKSVWAVTAAVALCACSAPAIMQEQGATSEPAPTAALPRFDISYQKHILPNGLTLIVHEDHKAPIVSVNVWYHVGSKDETPGKTGFAHLFEHLMFNGSENYRDEYFKPFERVGATTMNGTTSFDRTNYFQNVPTTAVDMALWMESDRMGHLLGAIDQDTLDEQRGVVQNENRQRENQPYGKTGDWLFRASFPEGHPYRWLPIGSMDDLNAASLDDVKAWFEGYYGAANVTIVLAGDIDFATAKAKVEKYFGDIPAGPPLARRQTWIAARDAPTRDLMYDRVAQPRVGISWNVPPFGSDETEQLQLVAQILGGGKTSRLYERLVYRDQRASSASAWAYGLEIAGLWGMDIDVKPGEDTAEVEAIARQELRRFIEHGPTQQELDRARTSAVSQLVRGAEAIGGFGGKSDLLASCEVYTGDPGCVQRSLAVIEAATPATLQAVAKRWLSQGDYTLTVQPYPQFSTAAATVDRSAGPPAVDEFPSLNFPALQRATLSNGIPVVFAERHDVPVVDVLLQFDAGYASDAPERLGTSSFTLSMLDEGTEQLDTLAIAQRLEELGAQFDASSSLDASTVSLSALTPNLQASLALYAQILRHPAFRDADVQRLKGQWLVGIAQEKTDPVGLATRVLPPLLYGAGHAYAIPLSGMGTAESISTLSADDLRAYHRQWLRPDLAQLIVVGDTTLEAVLPQLEQALGDWRAPATPPPVKNIAKVALPDKPRLFLMDRPDAQQSIIIAGQVAPPSGADNALEIMTMNAVLGATFTSRLNMNLREDKHWAYGARSLLSDAVGQRPFMMYAPVQADKTAESMQEMLKEARGYVGANPATAEEVEKIKQRNVRSLPGRFETADAVVGTLADMLLLGRPDDYVQTLKQRTEAQTLEGVRAAAREVIHPDQLTWVVVGDLSKIEAPLRALNLGEVVVLDADGQPQR